MRSWQTPSNALHPSHPLRPLTGRRYEYVKTFERADNLLPGTWIVVRLDGRGFHGFTARHNFAKPNDRRALELMNAAAVCVVTELPDVVVAYGISDEFSFVLRRDSCLFDRRESKLVSTITSLFTAHYVHLWPAHFPSTPLLAVPSFDGRAVLYPSTRTLRDYLSWRQVDAHINNLYNTAFWALVLRGGDRGQGLSPARAESELAGTLARDKHELLWSRFGINYNDEDEMFKKGSVVFREFDLSSPLSLPPLPPLPPITAGDSGNGIGSGNDGDTAGDGLSKSQREKRKKMYKKARVVVRFCDIIKDAFWDVRPWILGDGAD